MFKVSSSRLSLIFLGIVIFIFSLAKCEPSCDDGGKLQYEAGKAYVYSVQMASSDNPDLSDWLYPFRNSWRSRDSANEDRVKGEIITEGEVVLTALKNCEYVLTLTQNLTNSVIGTNGNYHLSGESEIPRTSVKFAFRNGEVADLTKSANEDKPWVVNMARGILTMLQNNQFAATPSANISVEKTIRGMCASKSFETVEGHYQKRIPLCSCSGKFVSGSEGIPYHNKYNKAVEFPESGAFLTCTHTLKENHISAVDCSETNLLYGVAHRVLVKSKMFLDSRKTGKEPGEVGGATETEISALTEPICLTFDSTENIPEEEAKKNIHETILKMALGWYQDPEANKALIYLGLKEKLKYVTNFTEIEEMIEKAAPRYPESCPVAAKKFVTEVATEIGTEAALSYIMELIQEGTLRPNLKVRFYSHLSFSKNPTTSGLLQLAKLLKNDWLNLQNDTDSPCASKSFRALVLGSSSYAYQFCQKNPSCSEESEYTSLVNEIADIISHSATQTQITPALLHALGNLPHLTSHAVTTIKDILTKGAADSNDLVRILTTFQAFRRNPCQPTLKEATREILQSASNSAEIRMEAYMALIRCVEEDDVTTIKNILLEDPKSSLSGFIASHVSNLRNSQSPSKLFVKNSPLNGFYVPENVTSVHNITGVSKYAEFSLFREQYNLGFSTDGYVIFEGKGPSAKPRFMLFNVTLDLFGKSYNNLQVGLSKRYDPDMRIMLYQGNDEKPCFIKTMLKSYKAADSFLRVHGTTVVMGSDIFGMIKTKLNKKADDAEEDDTGNFRKTFEFVNQEIMMPTLTGLPLTINPHVVSFPMLSKMTHRLNDKGSSTRHKNVSFEYSLLAGVDVRLGKGTPLQVGHSVMFKRHMNYTLNYEVIDSIDSSARNSELKIRLPEQIIASERFTTTRRFYFIRDGEFVRSWDVFQKLHPPTIPRQLFTASGMGLTYSVQALGMPNCRNRDDGPVDVIFKLEKTKEELTGYTVAYSRNATDGNGMYEMTIKTDGLTTSKEVHLLAAHETKHFYDLQENDDQAYNSYKISAEYLEYDKPVAGFKVLAKSAGLKKSEMDLYLGECGQPNLLTDITSGFACRTSYLLKVDSNMKENEITWLDWSVSSANTSVDTTLKFGGPLDKYLGQIEAHATYSNINEEKKPDSDNSFVIMIYQPKVHIKLDVTQESKSLGKNKISAEYFLEKEEISGSASMQIGGDRFALTMSLPKPTVTMDYTEDGHTIRNHTHTQSLTTKYTDGFKNDATLTITRKSNQDTAEDHQSASDFENYVVELEASCMKNPVRVEFHTGEMTDTTRRRVHDGLQYRMLGLRVVVEDVTDSQFLYEKSFTETEMDSDDPCQGRQQYIYSYEFNNGSYKCLTSSERLEINIPDHFELSAESSTDYPEQTVHALLVHIPEPEWRVNYTSIESNNRKFFSELHLENLPYHGEEWDETTEIDFDPDNRTIHMTTQVTQTRYGEESTWTTLVDGTWAMDIFDGESTMKIVHTDPRMTITTVDVLNNATSEKPYCMTNTLTATVDKTGLSRMLIPKKRLTWVVNVDKNTTSDTEEDYFFRVNTTSDLKWEILNSPPKEVYHLRETFELTSDRNFDNVTYRGRAFLSENEKPKAGYKFDSRLSTRMYLVVDNGTQLILTESSRPRKHFKSVITAWLMEDENGTPIKNKFAHGLSVDLHPDGDYGKTSDIIADTTYIRMKNLTGEVVSRVDVHSEEQLCFKDSRFIANQMIELRIDNKTSSYSHEGYLSQHAFGSVVSRQDDHPLTAEIWVGLSDSGRQYKFDFALVWSKKFFLGNGTNHASHHWLKMMDDPDHQKYELNIN